MSSLDPSIWGRKTWFLLHCLTFLAKEDLPELFYHLQFILPCEKCRHSYKEHLEKLPIPTTKKDFPKWLIQVHNRVNLSIGKKEENVEDLLIYWKEQAKHITKEDIIIVLDYFMSIHPGYYKISHEMINAHVLLWNVLHKTFPAIKQLPSMDTISHKMLYLEWFKNKFGKSATAVKKCTLYCKI